MEQPEKRYVKGEDEINLYDYWNVIVKRKKMIIGLFLIAVAVTAIVSLFMPKIYRGEGVLRVGTKDVIKTKDMISIIGKLDNEKNTDNLYEKFRFNRKSENIGN